MKQTQSTSQLRRFVYIDSSQEEPNQEENIRKGQVLRQCNVDYHISSNNYPEKLRKIVQQQIDKIQNGDVLLVEPNDKEIAQAFRRRKEKYKYFLKQMEIDARYDTIIGGKVAKLRSQNQKKKQILVNKRRQDKCKKQEQQLRKFVIEKQDKQQKVIKGVQQIVHKLGVERNAHIKKKIKTQVEIEKELTQNQLDNLRNKQKNQLEELRSRYQEIKEEQKMNKKQQEKVLRDIKAKNQKLKNHVQTKLLIKKDFII